MNWLRHYRPNAAFLKGGKNRPNRPKHRQMPDAPQCEFLNLFFSFPEPLRDQFDDTTGLGYLLLGQLANIPGTDNEGELGEPSFS